MSNAIKIFVLILTIFGNSNCVNGSKNSLPFLAYLDLSGKSKDSPFTIAQITPGSGVSNIPLNTSIQVTFSSDFDSSSLNSSSFFLEKNGIRIQANLSSSATSAVLTPSSDLSALATYKVTIKQDVKSASGVALKEDLIWEFTTAGIVDAIAPALSLRTPSIGASMVSNNTSIQLAFTEAVDCTTVNYATFLLKDENTQVSESSSINCLGSSATLTPDNPLIPNTTYRVNVNAFITDLANNSLSAQSWTFTTGAGPDLIPPVVSFASPNPSATDVSINASVSAAFSEEIHCGSVAGNFTLDDNVLIPGTISVVLSCSGTTASITPTSTSLAYNTTYTAKLTNGITDLYGNPLTINPSNTTWTFTTGSALDSTAPTVTSTVPSDNSNGIGTNVTPMAVFSETMACGSVNAASFKVRKQSDPPGVYLAGTVNCFGTSATWTPNPINPFSFNTAYTAEINNGALDNANNAAVATSWNFTTGPGPDLTSPNLSFATPANGTLNVPINTSINVAFDEKLNCGSVLGLGNIVLDDDPSTPATTVTLNITCNGNTVIVTPSPANLAYNTTYTVKLTNGLTDLFGNPLTINGNTTWTFTTGAAPDLTAPQVALLSPVSGATNVATNASITVAFNENIDCSTLIFTMNNGIAPGSINCAGASATFVPSALTPLNSGTTYQATIGTVKDLRGNPIAAPTNWTFSTGLAPDVTPPTGTIQNLKNNGIVTSGFVIGTANDNRSVSLVEVSIDGGTFANATGTTNWKFQLPAGAGTWRQNSQHTIQVRTTDSSNNVSLSAVTTVRKGTNQDINGDGYGDLVTSEYGQGLVYIFHSSGMGGIAATNAQFASKILIGSATEQFGRMVTLGDMNGDGYADLIVGAPLWNTNVGRVYIFHSAGNAGITTTFSVFANSAINGTVASGEFGSAAVAGDVNGDGYADLVASAPLGPGNVGTVYVFVSNNLGIAAATVAGAVTNRTGAAGGDGFGVSLALGNINGDNFADIAVGSSAYNTGKGRIYAYYGAAGGLNAAAPNTLTNNSSLGMGMGMFGKSLAMGDLNGDGYSDVIAGAHQLDVNGVAGSNYGTVRLWISSGTTGVGTDTIGNVAYINGTTTSDFFGQTLTVQDLDSDGRADIIVGADQAAVPTVYVYMTPAAPALAVPGMRTKIANATTSVTGVPGLGATAVGNMNYCTPIGTGDPNGDGFPDLYIGGNGTTGVYIFNSSAAGLVTNTIATAASNIANPNLGTNTYGVSVR